jgi:hypothetical protein
MKKASFAVLLGLIVLAAHPAAGQVRFGPQVSWGDDADLAIGGKLLFGLASLAGESRNLEGSASLDWFLDCEGCSYFEITGGVLYRFDIGEQALPYAGGGLNFSHFSSDSDTPGANGSDSELGLALMGGIQFPLGALTAFTDARITLGGAEQAVISFGILLGGRGQ